MSRTTRARLESLRERLAQEPPPPPWPCEGCPMMQRYRHALAQIARHSACEYSRRLADDALASTNED